MFVLKKLISLCLYPMSLCVFPLAAGMVLLWFSRTQRAGKVLVTLGTSLLLLFEFRPFAEFVTESLEQRYPHLTSVDKLLADKRDPVKWVVVLGAGSAVDKSLPVNLQLHPIALARLVEGIRIYRGLPGSKLLLSGGRVLGRYPHAEILGQVAQQLGVKAEDIVLELESRDTEDEAVMIRPVVGKDRFVLVTSALHLPRSMALFEKLGMKPIPGPADQWSKPGSGLSLFSFFPTTFQLHILESSYHEYLGILWAKMRGAI